MAANLPSDCCTMGFLHKGTPTGTLKTFAGVSTYIAYPESKSTNKVIYILTDVIGHKFVNARLIADAFAKHGYLVVMPDLFNDDPVPLNKPKDYPFMKWLGTHGPDVTQPIVERVLEQIKSEFKPTSIGAVGYCFGAKYVTRLLASDSDIVKAGYNAHPSFVTLEEVSAIKGPLSITAAETDEIFTTELRHQSEAALAKGGKTYQITLYSGTSHGFSVRGDENDDWVNYAKEGAFTQALAWFARFL